MNRLKSPYNPQTPRSGNQRMSRMNESQVYLIDDLISGVVLFGISLQDQEHDKVRDLSKWSGCRARIGIQRNLLFCR
ncbi:hypothetical protein L1987_87714 [Smallanthus sonchifolius]|nr:hypothetical protein L1987_87714 [Smallanthus sonchifolius]